MSIGIMAQVWDNGPSNRVELLVLLALADFADDQGRCWPSMKAVAAKARISERGAQKAIRRLEAAGYIRVITGGGRHGCNQYAINPEPDTVNTDAKPRTGNPEPHSGGERENTKPRTGVQKTPNGGSPEPSRTVIEPSKEEEAADARACEDASRHSPTQPKSDNASCGSMPAPDADELYDRVLAAAGHASGRQLPTWWMPPAAILHVQRWRDLGISDDEIVEVVRQTQARFDGLTGGPKAFDRAMAAYAAEKAEPALTPAVQHMNGGRPQPPPQCKPDIYQAVIEKARRGEL